MDKPSYYAIIPASVRYDTTLRARAILLYGEITALCYKEGYCWSTNEYFAKLYGIKNPKTAGVWVNQLRKRGHIRVVMEYAPNSKRLIKRRLYLTGNPTAMPADTPPLNNVDPTHLLEDTPPPNNGEPPHQKVEDNNTVNNTFNNTTNKGTRFTPPSVDEVTDYCNQRNNLVDAQTFVNFYQAKGWMVGKNKMKDWKASVRTWETNQKQRYKPKQQALTKDSIKGRTIEDSLTNDDWAYGN
ncbi:MAG: helix-turn-helix domain-containing protein [Flavobacteriaceae bacterium]|nr:helix-turn-helix domain-containing protein [Flavobacteriaceae bacterium]